MDLRARGSTSHFLGCLGGPFEDCGCCCGLSLKQGVFIIGILDITSAILCLAQLIVSFEPAFSWAYTWVILAKLIYGISLGVFAVLGMNGVIRLKVNWLNYFLYASAAYVPLRIVDLVVMLGTLGDYMDGDERFGFVLDVFIGIAIALYICKVLWSTVKRLENNEATLVMHGKAAAQLMQQQTNSLGMQPGFYAAPGQPVPQYELK